uniref:RNase H type-1 domain-containing protein n=1 Tax=Cannabis sativa TaxID=3483 RepID=A0A803NU09_CANSA
MKKKITYHSRRPTTTMTRTTDIRPPPREPRVKLSPPPSSVKKIDGRYGIGYVARNVAGSLVIMAKDFVGKVASEVAKASGIKEVLSWLKLDHHNVTVEMDSLVVVEAIFEVALCAQLLVF